MLSNKYTEFELPILIKLGGSVITEKDKDFTAREETIRRLADEIASSQKPVIVVHGAGSFGHGVAAKYELSYGTREPRQFRMFSFLRTQMDELRLLVSRALFDVDLRPFPIQPSAIFVTMDGKVFHFDDHALLHALRLGYTPVLHGDAVLDYSRGSSILSGDTIIQLLAKFFSLEKVIFVTDVEGIYDKDPKLYPDAELLRKLKLPDLIRLIKSDSVGGSTYEDVTRGMKGKLEAMLPILDANCEVAIINGNRDGALYNVLIGADEHGTFISPK